jgi:hypothetical protein
MVNDKLILELDRIANLAGTLRRSMELQLLDRSDSLPDIALVAHIERSLNSIPDLFDSNPDEYLDVDLAISRR